MFVFQGSVVYGTVVLGKRVGKPVLFAVSTNPISPSLLILNGMQKKPAALQQALLMFTV